MSHHTITATVWECSPEGATIRVYSPLPGTTVEKSIDVPDLRDATVRNALSAVMFDTVVAMVGAGKDIPDPHLEIRVKIKGHEEEVRTTKTY